MKSESSRRRQGNERLRTETEQCYLRLGFGCLALILLFIADHYQVTGVEPGTYLFLVSYVFWSFCYYGFVRLFPSLLVSVRPCLPLVTDILATAWVIYLTGQAGSVIVAFFLWYIIGYGMRYGIVFALAATLLTSVCWWTLAVISPYWNNLIYHVVGWQIAFLVIPLYYFILVKQLQITRRKLQIALQRAERLANFDSLTNLANRNYFNLQVEQMPARCREMAVMLIDLDGFKQVNDQLGHEAGDRVLIRVARGLKKRCPADCLIGRLGGDEFIVAIADRDKTELAAVAEGILEAVSKVGAEFNQITASVGISRYPQDGQTLSELKKMADISMYAAKRQGKNRYLFTS